MWGQMINAGLGIWLMGAPAILSYAEPARTNDHIVGPLVATFATIAVWEVTRPLRWVNLLLGVWLLIAPLALGYGPGASTLNSLAVGAIVAVLAAFPGKIAQRFGGGWSSLWRSGASQSD